MTDKLREAVMDQMDDLARYGIAITGTDGQRISPKDFYMTPEHQLIERMALAIVNADQERLDMPTLGSVDEFRRETDREVYEMFAKAALAAIRETHAIVPREPTPDMKMKGAKAITSDHMKKMANYDAAIDCYSAMIEAGEVKP